MAITKLTNSGLSGDKYPNLMADNTFMEPIATTLVGAGGVSSITFNNIPQIYKHLQLRYIGAWTGTSIGYAGIAYSFNSDTGANYSGHGLYGTGSGSGSDGGANRNYGYSTWIPDSLYANIFGVGILDILDYTNQNKYKTVRCIGGFSNNTTATQPVGILSASWMNTSAINKITLSGNTFAQNSRFSLYGIRG